MAIAIETLRPFDPHPGRTLVESPISEQDAEIMMREGIASYERAAIKRRRSRLFRFFNPDLGGHPLFSLSLDKGIMEFSPREILTLSPEKLQKIGLRVMKEKGFQENEVHPKPTPNDADEELIFYANGIISFQRNTCRHAIGDREFVRWFVIDAKDPRIA